MLLVSQLVLKIMQKNLLHYPLVIIVPLNLNHLLMHLFLIKLQSHYLLQFQLVINMVLLLLHKVKRV
ncbi:MAG: hypothetical protein CMH03_09795 [Marinovum sp.]|nr:hypothetical protein [Marinovum sp.]